MQKASELGALVDTLSMLQANAVCDDTTRLRIAEDMRASLSGVRVKSLVLCARARGGGGGGGAGGADADGARRAALRMLRATLRPLVAATAAPITGYHGYNERTDTSRLLVHGIAHYALRDPGALHVACGLSESEGQRHVAASVSAAPLTGTNDDGV